MIVNEITSPILVTPPLVNVGVTLIVAKTGSVVKLVAVKFISLTPERLAPISMSDVQLNVEVPEVFWVENNTLTSSKLQTTWLAI